MNERAERTVRYVGDFSRYYEASPLGLPSADIFCCGPRDTSSRLAALINVLCRMKTRENKFPISRVMIIFPAGWRTSIEDCESDLRTAVDEVMPRFYGEETVKRVKGFLRKRLEVQPCPNLGVDSAVALIESAEPYSVLVFVDATQYRQADLEHVISTSESSIFIPEDVWVRHVHAFAERSMNAARKGNCYVVLDTGEFSPYRSENADVLRSIEGCGVLGSRTVGDPHEDLVTKLGEWTKQMQAGCVGPVFSEIDALHSSSDREKRLLKIQLLSRAGVGMRMEVLEFLRQEAGDISGTDGHVLVRFAHFARLAGDSELALEFLKEAVPELTAQEDLELASSLGTETNGESLSELCLQRLETLFPQSRYLEMHRFTDLLNSREYEKAIAMISDGSRTFPPAISQFYVHLMTSFKETSQPDYASLLADTRSKWPDALDRAQLMCAADARARGLPRSAMAALTAPGDEFSGRVALSLLQSMHSVLIEPSDEENQKIVEEELRHAVHKLVKYVSIHPEDSSVRNGLITFLSPATSGTLGLGLIAFLAIELSKKTASVRKASLNQEGPPVPLADVPGILEPVLEWMHRQSPIVIGQCVVPKELLTVPADTVIRRLSRFLQEEGDKLIFEGHIKAFEMLLFAGIIIAPQSSNPDEDLSLLRIGAALLVNGGRVQRARDLTEQGLHMGGKRQLRTRLAWFAFAEVYQRLHNPIEALVGIACTFACAVEITTEQAWYEIYLFIRLLRDLNLTPFAESLLPVARALVRDLGQADEFQHRFATLELSVRASSLLNMLPDKKALVQEFVSDAVELCESVMERNDELAPPASLLAQGVYLSRVLSIPLQRHVISRLDLVLSKTAEPLSGLIRFLTLESPDAPAILNLARRLEPARYASDTGFDLRYVVMGARRLLDSTDTRNEPEGVAMAIELLADQSLSRHSGGTVTEDALHGIPSTVNEPSEFAREWSRSGVDVVLMGLSATGSLVRVTASNGALSPVNYEDSFSKAAFDKWSEEFPYSYGFVDEEDNLFYTSMREVGISMEQSRQSVFIVDAALSQIPFSLLLVGGGFIGTSVAVAAAPSLAWLKSAGIRRRSPSERRCAWIPTAADEGQNSTLTMVAKRLEATLDSHAIVMESGLEIPSNLKGAELVIVVAHGSVSTEGRYFRAVADETGLRMSPSDVSRSLGGVELVILFVCSGGRSDKHPFSNSTVGLVRDLLNRGCISVIASPWPLDARVASHWLPTFLACWESGHSAMDANFEANKAVEKAMGNSPGRYLAMAVFGDPLLVKLTRVAN